MRVVLLLMVAAGCIEGESWTGGAALEDDGEEMVPAPESPTPAYAVLATGQLHAMDVAIDDQYVYWLVNHQSDAGSKIHRVPKIGGAVETILEHPGRIYQFALDDDYIYAPTYVQHAPGGELLRIPKAGGPYTVLGDGMRYLAFVAVDESSVYVSPLVDEDPIEYELWSFAKADNAQRNTLVDDLLGPDSIVLDSDKVYVTNTGNSLLLQASRNSRHPTEPLPGQYALRVAGDAERVYFVGGAIGECTGARIYAWPKSGAVVTDLGASSGCPLDLTVTSEAVLTVETSNPGRLVAFPLDGSGRHELVSGLGTPSAVVAEADGSSVFWVDFSSGEVARIDSP